MIEDMVAMEVVTKKGQGGYLPLEDANSVKDILKIAGVMTVTTRDTVVVLEVVETMVNLNHHMTMKATGLDQNTVQGFLGTMVITPTLTTILEEIAL